MNVFKFTCIIWICWITLCFEYTTIVDIFAFKRCIFNYTICWTSYVIKTVYTLSNNHLSESKGTRKGIHKAKVGHRHGVDFSMGYWTEIKDTSVTKLHFLFCTYYVTAALIFRPTLSFPWFCVTSLHCLVTVALWKTAFLFYFVRRLKLQMY